jgi:hypothetical protein
MLLEQVIPFLRLHRSLNAIAMTDRAARPLQRRPSDLLDGCCGLIFGERLRAEASRDLPPALLARFEVNPVVARFRECLAAALAGTDFSLEESASGVRCVRRNAPYRGDADIVHVTATAKEDGSFQLDGIFHPLENRLDELYRGVSGLADEFAINCAPLDSFEGCVLPALEPGEDEHVLMEKAGALVQVIVGPVVARLNDYARDDGGRFFGGYERIGADPILQRALLTCLAPHHEPHSSKAGFTWDVFPLGNLSLRAKVGTFVRANEDHWAILYRSKDVAEIAAALRRLTDEELQLWWDTDELQERVQMVLDDDDFEGFVGEVHDARDAVLLAADRGMGLMVRCQ